MRCLQGCRQYRLTSSRCSRQPFALGSLHTSREWRKRLDLRVAAGPSTNLPPDNRRDPESAKRRALEDELRDPRNFLEYFLPRPLRLTFFGASAASCLIASLLTAVRVIQSPAVELADGLRDLLINVIGLATFIGLYVYDKQQAQVRIEKRREIREAQIAIGDREVYVNDKGEKMSRLKEVDDDWIVRRLERWGRRDCMPFIGPLKGALLQELLLERRPRLVVEVGTMAGYSALLMAQAIPPDGRVLTFEKDLSWFLVAKRFLWQASQGGKNAGLEKRVGERVEVVWGDATTSLSRTLTPGRDVIDLLFLDGTPREYLQYLQAAEPFLAPGSLVVADNAGVFASGGLAPYLEYVRGSGGYTSRLLPCKLEWRDDVDDGIEVSMYSGGAVKAAASGEAAAAQ